MTSDFNSLEDKIIDALSIDEYFLEKAVCVYAMRHLSMKMVSEMAGDLAVQMNLNRTAAGKGNDIEERVRQIVKNNSDIAEMVEEK